MPGSKKTQKAVFFQRFLAFGMFLLLIIMLLFLSDMLSLFGKKANTENPALAPFNSVDEELGWYYGSKNGKKPGTPSDWVLKLEETTTSKWVNPSRENSLYPVHKRIVLGQEFTLDYYEPAMLVEDKNNLENNFAILNHGVIHEIELEEEGTEKRAFVASVTLRLRFGKETTFVELGKRFSSSRKWTEFTTSNWHGYTVSLVSVDTIDARSQAPVVLKVKKSGIAH